MSVEFVWEQIRTRTLKAIKEAEAYPGPSLIIAYSPCIAHGIRGGLGSIANARKTGDRSRLLAYTKV